MNDYTKLYYGTVTVETTYDLFMPDYENQIIHLTKEIKRDILHKVADGQSLSLAIRSVDVRFGSPAMKLQRYVARDEHYGHTLKNIEFNRAEYESLEGGYNGKVFIHSMVRLEDSGKDIISGFEIEYSFHYDGIYYSGLCKVDVPQFRWIYRRQKLVNAMKKLVGMNAA